MLQFFIVIQFFSMKKKSTPLYNRVRESGKITSLLLTNYFLSFESVVINRKILDRLKLNLIRGLILLRILIYLQDYQLFLMLFTFRRFYVDGEFIIKVVVLKDIFISSRKIVMVFNKYK